MQENWAVLFVATRQEEKVRSFIADRADSSLYMPFVPTKDIYIKKNNVKKVCFPGYVFVGFLNDVNSLIKDFKDITRETKDAYRFLYYDDNKNDISLRSQETAYLKAMLDKDSNIKSSIGIIEGDAIRITEGPLRGLESRIVKINRHKRKAFVELEMFGEARLVSVGLEVTEKL